MFAYATVIWTPWIRRHILYTSLRFQYICFELHLFTPTLRWNDDLMCIRMVFRRLCLCFFFCRISPRLGFQRTWAIIRLGSYGVNGIYDKSFETGLRSHAVSRDIAVFFWPRQDSLNSQPPVLGQGVLPNTTLYVINMLSPCM